MLAGPEAIMNFWKSNIWGVLGQRAPLVLPVALLLLAGFLPVAGVGEGLSLEETYQLAKKQSESLAIRQQDIKIAEARYRQLLGEILPNIHALANQRWRNDDYSTINQNDSATSRGGSDRTHEFQTALVLQQPIFSGFRDYFAAQAAKQEIVATRYDAGRADELLFQDVAELYHQIKLYQSDQVVLREVEKILKSRIEELQRFLELGKSRESEILAAESAIADSRAMLDLTQGLLDASKEALAFLTGVPAQDLELKGEPIPAVHLPLESYLEQGATRLDLKAAAARRDSRVKQLKSAERARWPRITFEGSAYPYEDPDLNRNWDVLLNFNLPIFEGGKLDAQIAEQAALLRTQELRLIETRRSVDREIRIAYSDFNTSLARMKSLEKVVEVSRKSYESQRRDYELGVVTNLDVLESIRQGREAYRQLLAAQSALKINAARLAVAAGGAT